MGTRYHAFGKTFFNYAGMYNYYLRECGYPPSRAYKIENGTAYYK